MLLAELLLAHTQHYRFITVQIVQSWRRLVTCRTDSITVDIHFSQHFSGTMFLDGISVVLFYSKTCRKQYTQKKKSVTCFTDSVCRLSFQFSLFQVLQTMLSHSVKYDVIVKTQRCVTVCLLCGVLTDFHFSSQTATNFFSPPLMGHVKTLKTLKEDISNLATTFSQPEVAVRISIMHQVLPFSTSLTFKDVYLSVWWLSVWDMEACCVFCCTCDGECGGISMRAPFQPRYVAHIIVSVL